jgi:hypothetical protein
MGTGTRSTDATSGRIGLRELGLGAAWMVGVAAGVEIVQAMIGQNPLASAVLAAVVVELAANRAGVRWDDEAPRDSASLDDAARSASRRRSLRRLGAGLLAGTAVTVFAVAAVSATGRATIELGRPGTSLIFSVVRAGAIGVRDELLLRGLPLYFAAKGGVRGPAAIAFAALAGGATIALVPDVTPEAVALALASGWLYAVLWRRYRSAWAAIGAHAAFAFLAGPGLRGAILDVTFAAGSLADGPKASGAPTWLAALGCAALALGLGLRRRTGLPTRAR